MSPERHITGHPPTVRLFVAAELPDELRGSLASAMEVLRRAGVEEGLRWVRPEAVHLTLRFLGDTPADRIDAIATALRGAVPSTRALELRPSGLGCFHGGRGVVRGHRTRESHHHNVRVVWVGLEGDVEPLGLLASRIEIALEPLGIPREERPFFPHLTLARMRERADRAARERAYAALRPFIAASTARPRPSDLAPALPSFRIDRVALVESTLAPGGPSYRALETFTLGE